MPIEDLGPRLRELGRIRIGKRVEGTNKKGDPILRPTKLDTFRLTARSKELIEAAASQFGGTPQPWENEGEQWEVVTERDWLPALIPPPHELDQSWELWSGGGPLRRCTGHYTMDGEDCLCPSDYEERMAEAAKGTACKPTSRLKLMIPGLPDIGVWRLETHGYYAATELMGAMALVHLLAVPSKPFPVTLRLEQRVKKVAGGSNIRYAVPALELPVSVQAALEATGREDVMELGPALDDRPKRQLRASEPEPSESPAATEAQADDRSGDEAAGDPEEAPGGGGDAHGIAVDTAAAAAPTRASATPAEIRELGRRLGAESDEAMKQLFAMWKSPDEMTARQRDSWRRTLEDKIAVKVGAM